MSALAVTTVGAAESAGACTDGTRQFPAVGMLLADGATLFSGALAAGTAVVGKVGIDQTTPGTTNAVQAVPGTAGGCTPYSFLAAAGANQDSTVVKASAGQLYGSIAVTNTNAAVRYLKVYDKATAPTSADTPKLRITVPGATTGAGIVVPLPDAGVAFANGIAFRMTTGAADNDANAVTANEVILNGLFYK